MRALSSGYDDGSNTDASRVVLKTDGFTGLLSDLDDNVQKALETLDQIDILSPSDADLRYIKRDQTTPQTFTAGTVTGTGLLNVTAGQLGLDTNTYLTSVAWNQIGGTQSDIYLSGFYNDLGNYGGWLTYYDTIGYAENAGHAYYADSCNYAGYASSCDYAYYWNGYSMPDPSTAGYLYSDGYGSLSWANIDLSSLSQDLNINGWLLTYGDSSTFFDSNNSILYIDSIREHTTGHGVDFSDGTNTMTIAGTSGLSYIEGASDILATLNGTFCHYIDAGTSIPFSYTNTKASTNSVIEFGRFGRKTTGVAADGIGGKIPFYLTNDNGDQEIFAQLEVVSTDVSDGTEDADVVIKTMVGGTLVEKFRVGSQEYEPKITAGTTSQVFLGDKSLANANAVGGLSLVATASPSSAANFTFSSLSPGVNYMLVMELLQNTSNGSIQFVVNSDTSSVYTYQITTSIGSTASASSGTTTSGKITANTVGSTWTTHSICYFRTTASTNNSVRFTATSNYVNGTPATNTDVSGVIYQGASALSTLTIQTSAGTMTGTAKLYRLN